MIYHSNKKKLCEIFYEDLECLFVYLLVCGGNYSGDYGEIFSPYWPFVYPQNLDCLYTISVPEGFIVELEFSDFNLSSSDSGTSMDYIKVCQFELWDIVCVYIVWELIIQVLVSYLLLHNICINFHHLDLRKNLVFSYKYKDSKYTTVICYTHAKFEWPT